MFPERYQAKCFNFTVWEREKFLLMEPGFEFVQNQEPPRDGAG
jgi:hypothetical protein